MTTTPTACDVAEFILDRTGPMSSLKLQKLVYYCQGWSLAWNDRRMFSDNIEAWKHGPVVRDLYEKHATMKTVSSGMIKEKPQALSEEEITTILGVLKLYGAERFDALVERTHQELPWKQARGSLAPSERSEQIIDVDVMRAFYREQADKRHRRVDERMMRGLSDLESLLETKPSASASPETPSEVSGI